MVSLNVSLPGFIGIFHTGLGTVQWIITGFTLAFGMIAPVSGYLSSRFGGRRMFLLSLAGITVSSVMCSLSWNIHALIFFRILQGLWCGLIQPVSLAMIYQTLPRGRQPLAVSVWSFSTVLGTAVGPSDVRGPQKRLDSAGLLLATVGSLAILLLFGNLHAWGMRSVWTWGSLLIGGACTALFIRVELRAKEPLLNLRLFGNFTFAASLGVSLILSFALYSGVYFVPLFLEEVQGLSSFQVGLLFLPAAACLTLATFLSGKGYRTFGPAALIALGSLILLVTTFRFSRLGTETTLVSVMIWLAIRNVGTGLSLTPATSAAMAAVPQSESGHASALINWLRQLFSAGALGMFTSVFYTRMSVHESRLHANYAAQGTEWIRREAYTRSIDDAFLFASALVALAIPLALLLRKRKEAAGAGPRLEQPTELN
ncbi:hypothetical protein BGX30_003609 [Mortierella sp. GBA39]|nr:hypothetical protein BGX30_003609 [Mortierella sp. GBA39]